MLAGPEEPRRDGGVARHAPSGLRLRVRRMDAEGRNVNPQDRVFTADAWLVGEESRGRKEKQGGGEERREEEKGKR